ncbi:MAG TPA: dihydroxyacetone kinase subunit DhaL [Gammaproteobacteria bacterium]|nr:dihydroxyacetone kinase subunit DhaL [Gammaproteobacteria bacterium]
MKEITLKDVELAIQTIADTALRNEKYFSELDSAAGDADFGVSLASGFKAIKKDWEQLDKSSIGTLLLKISMIISRNVGGCSGPIWGTGFMRAGMLSKDKASITLDDLEKMLTASIEGIQQRGGAVAGDKTLLDALIPVRDTIKKYAGNPDAEPQAVLREAAEVATDAIEKTRDWVARRGRQSFTGERSKGTLDPGIVAVATMLNDLCKEVGVEPASAKAAR